MRAKDAEVPALTVPPQDVDAELALLGAMILNPGAITVARDRVTADQFYRPSHGAVFMAILDMDARGESVDAVTLGAELRRLGRLEDVGGADFVHALPDLCPVAVSVAQYAKVVVEIARRRRGIELSRRLETAFVSESSDVQNAVGRDLLRHLGLTGGECRSLRSDDAAASHGVAPVESAGS